MQKVDPASFRDPDGYVFHEDGVPYRAITNPKAPLLDEKYRPFFEAAVERRLLIGYEPVNVDHGGREAFRKVIRPKKLPIVTYPYEWCFEQLKDAALVTLDLNILALSHGLTLKDATAFNVQRYGGGLLFIDHLSFELTDGLMPWKPYSQFCRHFLNPLAIGAFRDIHSSGLFQTYLDGIPTQLAAWLIPLRGRIRFGLFVHIVLHGLFIRRSTHFAKRGTKNRSHGKQIHLLGQLKNVVEKLVPAKAATVWADYYDNTNYGEEAFAEKKRVIKKIFQEKRYRTVWDIGSNTGEFSRLIQPCVEHVVSLDVDHNAVNQNYVENRRLGVEGVTPLVFDITNPSAGQGFGAKERPALQERSRPDAVLALALLHHLCITHNIPFVMVRDYFAAFACDLVIEFVDRDDSQFKRLIEAKGLPYKWYNRKAFEECFQGRYHQLAGIDLPGTHRSIYYFKYTG